MKNFNYIIKKSLIGCFLFVSAGLLAQITYTVNNNPNTTADFTDLQTAIDVAASGDIIYVQQSNTSYGEITINKTLTLVGRSHSDKNYKSEVGSIIIAAGSSNSVFKGLKIGQIFPITNMEVIISNLAFYDNYISAITLSYTNDFLNNIVFQGNVINSVFASVNTSNLVFTNNFFATTNIQVSNTISTIFTNNIINLNGSPIVNNSSDGSILNFSNCLFLGGNNPNFNGNFQLNNCLTYSYNTFITLTITYTNSTYHAVNNCLLNTDPLLTNVDPNYFPYQYNPNIDDLTLQPNSPAKGSGYGGVDMGVYENYNFKPFGTPIGVPSIKVESYSSTVPKNGNLSVTIKADAN